MKAAMGVSAVLVAGLHLPSAALDQGRLDELKHYAPAGVRLAQTGGANLPVTRVSGVSGAPIALDLKMPARGVRFIRISDFPAEIELSRGFRLRGAWMVSVNDLENLELITPAGLVKSIKLDVLYFRDNASPAVAQRVLMVELGVAEAVVQNAQQLNSRGVAIAPADPAPAPPAQAPAAKKTVSAERETESLERGAKLVRNGDIAAARLLYEDLALSGSAKGARALAETYDAAYLKGVFIAGLRPSPEKAKIWYELAAELGDTVSKTRLSAVDRR